MAQICKIVTLFALMLQLTSSIQALLEPALAPGDETAAENDDALYYAPSPYGGAKFPESRFPMDQMDSELEGRDGQQYPPSLSPSVYSPGSEQGYPYNVEYSPSPSPSSSPSSPSPSPYINVMAPEVDNFYYGDDYSPSEAPSPTDYGSPSSEGSTGSSMATPPPAEWEYSAEDDAGYLSGEDEDHEYGEEKKRGRFGLVIGAVCLLGLGGLAYRRRKTNKKRKHPVYVELSRSVDF